MRAEIADAGVDLTQLVDGDAERFLDEHMLASAERLQDDRRVKVVPGCDEDRLCFGVSQDLVDVRGREGESLRPAGVLRAHAGRRADATPS